MYKVSVLGTYFECEGVKEMYLLQLYLVTVEVFVVQRNRSLPPSMGYTHLTNKKWKPRARCSLPKFG